MKLGDMSSYTMKYKKRGTQKAPLNMRDICNYN